MKMSTEIKSKVQSIVESHTTAVSSLLGDIDRWNKDQVYADEYRQEKIQEIKQQIGIIDSTFNTRLMDAIQEEKDVLFGEPQEKPADYQMQIANALEFIKLAGNKLTDEQAHGILKPFQDDFDTMNLFHAAISGTVQGDVSSTFEQTFDKLYKRTALVNAFGVVEGLAMSFFSTNANGTLENGIRVNMFLQHIHDIQKLVQ